MWNRVLLVVLVGCSGGKDKLDPNAVTYAQKLSTVLTDAETFATELKAGLKKSVGPDIVRMAVKFETSAKELEAITAAPPGLTNCFAVASKFPTAIRAAAPIWLGEENKMKLAFAFGDPAVVNKLVPAVCDNASQVVKACNGELEKFDTPFIQRFTCP